jgi:hypothetical protein
MEIWRVRHRATTTGTNRLYFGDNLNVLRERIAERAVGDLDTEKLEMVIKRRTNDRAVLFRAGRPVLAIQVEVAA